jgi:peptidoglycan/xylan/chitin deacetylase (PgdA/CDA1 family)
MSALPRFSMSVDDGHPLDLRMADLLQSNDIKATFYLPLTNQEGAPVLSSASMRELAQSFEIGSHTRSHRFLNTLHGSEAWREIVDGKQQLQDQLGEEVEGFCYPGGRYHYLHKLQVRSAGFRYARTTQNLRVDLEFPLFEMPTTAQFYPHTRSVFFRNFISQRHWGKRSAAFSVALATDNWLMRLHALLDLAIAQRGVFHLWCHSIDIEKLQLWDQLDAFLSRVAHQIGTEQRVYNRDLIGAPPVACTSGSQRQLQEKEFNAN